MNNSILFVLGLGFALGLKHATEADHLIAVTTIVSEQRSIWRSSLVGALWGLGHTTSLFVAGVFVILLQVAIPERVAAVLEFCVALMIILLGTRILYLLLKGRKEVHVHAHTHEGHLHTHLHFHEAGEAHPATRAHAHDGKRHTSLSGWRPLFVGTVHGLAGSAVLTLFILNEIVMRGGSRLLGLLYLLIFGVGSIGGMLLMSMLISLPFVFTAQRFEKLNTPIKLFAGLASVAFGLYYALETARGL